ncbi:MAG: choline dehydrogenase [Pseudomonadota bacterium]|nr:choline dehydrogenase [Pseudomonadota bacterium]
MASNHYDVIIVGGGTAGCVLANALSEDTKRKVLVLEAGGMDSKLDFRIHMPAALSMPIGSRTLDWRYESEPEPYLKGRRLYQARGKVLGGSSSINGMIFQRGNPQDFNGWAQEQDMGHWSYQHVLPYYKRLESILSPLDHSQELSQRTPEFRGRKGKLKMEVGPCASPLFDAFFKATQQAGYETSVDVNGYRQEGFSPFDRTLSQGRRMSAARAYLHPVMHRPNLTVLCGQLIEEILLDGKKAYGVKATHKGKTTEYLAEKVICCAGAINTPQLLQVSGIGDPKVLEAAGVEVKHALSGVGANLQDHLEVYMQYACSQPVTMQPALKWWRKPKIWYDWLVNRSGPGASNHFEAGGFFRSSPQRDYPNVMIHFLPLAIRYDGSLPKADHGYQIHIGPMRPASKGHVHIRSQNVKDAPKIVFNYLSSEADRKEWIETIRAGREIMSQTALAPYHKGEINPGTQVQSDQEILDWVARDAETALHPCGTCKMGMGQDAVVNPYDFSVHGLQGLHVVDASIFPNITTGNLSAPVYMVAERAADALLGKAFLKPADIEYYGQPEKERRTINA